MIALSAMYLLVWWHDDLDAERTNYIMCTAAQREGLLPKKATCTKPNGKTRKEGLWGRPGVSGGARWVRRPLLRTVGEPCAP